MKKFSKIVESLDASKRHGNLLEIIQKNLKTYSEISEDGSYFLEESLFTHLDEGGISEEMQRYDETRTDFQLAGFGDVEPDVYPKLRHAVYTKFGLDIDDWKDLHLDSLWIVYKIEEMKQNLFKDINS